MTPAEVRARLCRVLDPELPVVNIVELGLVRDIEVHDDGVCVALTPTYSGCPALRVIEDEVAEALVDLGEVEIRTVHSPPWTTDWLTDEAKRKLRDAGIAPPGQLAGAAPAAVRCPRCDSAQTRLQSQFGATACKSIWLCQSCREPFELLKVI